MATAERDEQLARPGLDVSGYRADDDRGRRELMARGRGPWRDMFAEALPLGPVIDPRLSIPRRQVRRLTALACAALGSVLLGSACFYDPIDYTGKDCPCPEPEFRCNGVTAKCEEGAGDGGEDCTPLAVSTGFRVGWRTPNGVLWAWDPPPDLDDVRGYRLVLGPTEDAALAETDVIIFGVDQNPELGGPLLPFPRNTPPNVACSPRPFSRQTVKTFFAAETTAKPPSGITPIRGVVMPR